MDAMVKAEVAYSVIVPVYNSATTVLELHHRLATVMNEVVGASWELIFVNDGSADNSWSILSMLAERQDNVIAINLSRNYGQHNAIMCGFQRARGQAMLTIDDDLQHPPEEIPKLIERAAVGYDVVYGSYLEKKHSLLRNLGSSAVKLAYRGVFGISADLSSFRYVRGSVARKILSYDRSFTFVDGLLAWYTTRFSSVEVAHRERKVGRSGYSALRLLNLSMNLLTNFSTWPLKVATAAGFVFAVIGALLGLYFALKKMILGISVTGYTSLMVAITGFAGVQLMALGIVGEFIGRVHINVNKRPQYSVDQVLPAAELQVDEEPPSG